MIKSYDVRQVISGFVLLGLFLTCTAQAESIVLRNARVIDGGGGQPLDVATVLIKDGVISIVGPEGEVAIPANVRQIDLSGKTLMPGLISNHSHVGQTDGVSSGPENYNRSNIERQLRQFQRYGVTTVTSLGLDGPLLHTIRAEARNGIGVGSDIFSADRGIGVPEGAPPMNVGRDQLYRPKTPDEARAAVQEMALRKPDLVKIWVNDFNHTLAYKMKPEIYTAAIEQALSLNLRVAAHVYYLDDAKKLVAAGANILAHGVRDLPVDDELIALMKSKGTWYISTLGLDETFYVFAEQPNWTQSDFFREALQPPLATQFDDASWRRQTLSNAKRLEYWKRGLKNNQISLKRMVDAGVRVGFGTDSGATPFRIPGFAEHRELQLVVEAGLTPLQAITLATKNAAALLGLDDRGLIAPGKRADFIVLSGDPSHDIANTQRIESVWQEGRQVSGPIAGTVNLPN